MKKQNGFTIIEILIALGFMVALAPLILNFYTNSQKSKTAVQLADTSKSFSSAFNQHIKQNFAQMYEQAIARPSQVLAIKYNDVKDSGEFATLNSYNFNLTPCLLYKFNPSSRQIQAIMVFTAQSKSKPIDKTVGTKAAMEYGLGGGYYENGQVKGGTWSLSSSNEFLSAASQCGGQIPPYSPVINLSIANDFPSISDTDNYLSRLSDDTSKGGDSGNENTMQTDLYLTSTKAGETQSQSNAIYLEGSDQEQDGDKRVFIAGKDSDATKQQKQYKKETLPSNGSFAYVGGRLIAQSLSVQEEVEMYTPCNSDEQGVMVKQKPDTSLPAVGQLQCMFNVVQCSEEHYCYMPIIDLGIKFKPYTANYTCKIGFIDPTVPPDVREDQMPPTFQCEERYCAHWSIVGTCDRHDWDRYPNEWQNPTTTFSYSDEKKGGGYSIYKTITATTNWQIKTPNNHHSGGSVNCNPPAGQQMQMPGKIYGVTCITANPILETSN